MQITFKLNEIRNEILPIHVEKELPFVESVLLLANLLIINYVFIQ
jgi:hypothetical protein